MSTIYAQATAPGRAGVSVVRLSGPQAFEIAQVCVGSLPAPRSTALRAFVDADGEVIDRCLVLCFAGPASFTGEDVVEFHLHGSIAIVQAVLRRLGEFSDTALAQPGEFTRRALENDRMDLAQVEGLSDLIDAETEAQRKQAIRAFEGRLGDVVAGWRVKLIRAASLMEATIDFADEDVPVDVSDEVDELLSAVENELEQQIAGTSVAERIRSGFEVAILGAPNVGKSTLLNTLAGREAAITSSTAGTTRDVIEVRMNLRGLPVTLLDTAGIRDTDDEVEQIGISRALQRAANSDLRVFLATPDVASTLPVQDDDIVLQPKMDETRSGTPGISGLTGAGVNDLVDRIAEILSVRSGNAGLATHERHRTAMVNAREHLSEVRSLISTGPDLYDIAADELRHAVLHLDSLVGRIDVENLLDEIFSNFCIGK